MDGSLLSMLPAYALYSFMSPYTCKQCIPTCIPNLSILRLSFVHMHVNKCAQKALKDKHINLPLSEQPVSQTLTRNEKLHTTEVQVLQVGIHSHRLRQRSSTDRSKLIGCEGTNNLTVLPTNIKRICSKPARRRRSLGTQGWDKPAGRRYTGVVGGNGEGVTSENNAE